MSNYERCEYCGRFMKHIWFQANDHDDSWEDYWTCSRNEQHKADFPRDWGLS